MKFQDKYPVRIRRFNDMLRADLRFLEQGVSISNEVKSILIGYNELKEMAIDESLYLHLFYIKTYDNGISYNYEVLECNEKIFKAISKKCKVKIKKIKSNAKLKDKVILEGSCRLRKDAPGESIFKLSRILLQICKSIVDLPMPGSPLRSTTDPLTIPPPSTLSSSPILVM